MVIMIINRNGLLSQTTPENEPNFNTFQTLTQLASVIR